MFVHPSEIRSASSEELCGILSGRPGPTLVSQRIINEELEKRGQRCFGKVAIGRPLELPPGNGGAQQPKPEPGHTSPPAATSPEGNGEPKLEIVGSGTAFAVNMDGDLVTNEHVVDGCGSNWIASRGRVYPALVVAKDVTNDLAVISVPELPLTKVAKFGTDGPRLGEDVMAAGFPYAEMLGINLKTTFGNVTSLAGLGNNVSEFQLSAPIQPGNSGGPIISQSGAVIGVVTARLNDEYMLEKRREIGQLINFGVKSNVAAEFLRSHRIPIEFIGNDRNLSNAELAAEALDHTFLFVCGK